MHENGIALEEGKNLEVWLSEQGNDAFPKYDTNKGEKPYPQRYIDFKEALLPVHNSVEKGAMAAGAQVWMEKTKEIVEKADSPGECRTLHNRLIESDPIVYLNNHGQGHVDKVIEKVSEMLSFFNSGHLTPYEGFFLLCAIQSHDVGNIFGRSEHERTLKRILDEKGKPFIKDAIERKVIEKLALVHGGASDGELDTIGFLSESKYLFDRVIRKKLLAALLRFGDEIADDSSRADGEGLERGTIPEGSKIYHHYSAALHTVKLEKENASERVQLHLSFEFDSNIACRKFNKHGMEKYLLDEIYDRTLKMERERRYCMRFLRPFFSLDSIRIEIVIQNSGNAFKRDVIRYTLEEKGYPSDPASGCIKEFMSDIRTGEEEVQYLQREWGQQ